MRYLLPILFFFFAGCTDAAWDRHWGTLGKASEVKCYSGGVLIFHATSTGQVKSEEQSDGYFARWIIHSTEGEWVTSNLSQRGVPAGISGDCIFIYEP